MSGSKRANGGRARAFLRPVDRVGLGQVRPRDGSGLAARGPDSRNVDPSLEDRRNGPQTSGSARARIRTSGPDLVSQLCIGQSRADSRRIPAAGAMERSGPPLKSEGSDHSGVSVKGPAPFERP